MPYGATLSGMKGGMCPGPQQVPAPSSRDPHGLGAQRSLEGFSTVATHPEWITVMVWNFRAVREKGLL